MAPTFSQFKGKLIPSITAGVELCAIQQRSNIVDEHFITDHRQLSACTLHLNQL